MSGDVIITPLCPTPEVYLPWDTRWNQATGLADWGISNPAYPPGAFSEDFSADFATDGGPPATPSAGFGGLDADNPIGTAITLALLTDVRCPPDHPLAWLAGGDLRGWWGDGVDVRADLSEQPLGSLLWLLENATATADMARWAVRFASDALYPLIACGLATRITPIANVYPAMRLLTLDVTIVGSYGGQNYNRKYDAIWKSQ